MSEINEIIRKSTEVAYERGYLERNIEVLQLIMSAYERKLIDADSFANLKNILIKD